MQTNQWYVTKQFQSQNRIIIIIMIIITIIIIISIIIIIIIISISISISIMLIIFIIMIIFIIVISDSQLARGLFWCSAPNYTRNLTRWMLDAADCAVKSGPAGHIVWDCPWNIFFYPSGPPVCTC